MHEARTDIYIYKNYIQDLKTLLVSDKQVEKKSLITEKT